MVLEFLTIGDQSMISIQRLIAVVAPDSAPVRRLIQEARDRSMLIDCSRGGKTQSVLIMDSDHVILSPQTPEELAAKLVPQEEG